MPSLLEVQSDFAAAVFGDDADIVRHIVAGRMDPAERHAVYRRNIFHNYAEALRAVYPVVEQLVGEEFFRGASHRYIAQHPSRHGNLHDYGAGFGHFLTTFSPALGLPYLADVAHLEWLMHEAFHAADAPPADLAALAQVPPDRLPSIVFQLHPSCRLLASPYPVHAIWRAHQFDPPCLGDIDLQAGGASLLVARAGADPSIHTLTAGEYELVGALLDGVVLEAAWQRATAADESFDIAAFLATELCAAILVGFHLPS